MELVFGTRGFGKTGKARRSVNARRLTLESLETRSLLSTAAVPLPAAPAALGVSPLERQTPGDYEGRGVTDLAVYRPSTGQWIIQTTKGLYVTRFGDPAWGDVAVPGDYQGAGKTELAVFRPSTGDWLIRQADGTTLVDSVPGYLPGDLPVPGDYEGTGKTDLALYRPSTAQWTIRLSNGTSLSAAFGDPTQGDIPVPGDYDGSGKTNLAVFRPATDQWIIRRSTGRSYIDQFGTPSEGDIPVPGDYEGGGRTDLAVFRPATAQWVIRQSTGKVVVDPFGDPAKGDVPAGPAQTVVVPPAPFNNYPTHAQWMSLHDEFLNRANRGDHDVVFLGDSITFLWTDAGKTPSTASIRARFIPPRGTAAWNATFAPLGAVNDGIMGDTTNNLLWRLLNGEAKGNPKVVVLLIGINDLRHGSTSGETASGIIADAQAVRSFSPAARILVLGVLPPGGRSPGDPLLAAIKLTNSIVYQWTSSHGMSFADLGGLVSGQVDPNGHPTPQGYQTLARAIQGPVRALLGPGG